MEDRKFDLEQRLLDYAASIIRLVERMSSSRAANHVAGQLLRSGTAALPNHGEAQAAESPNDFVHKLRICLKELRETRRWLLLTKQVPLITPVSEVEPVLQETEELIKDLRFEHQDFDKQKEVGVSNSSKFKVRFSGI